MTGKQISLVLLTAFAIRVVYILSFFSPVHLEAEDQFLYLSLADAVAKGDWSALTPERTPGYPLFIAAIFAIFGREYVALLITQAMIDSLTCVVTGLLATKILGKGGLLTGMIAAVNLNMIVLSSMALTDSLFLFLFTVTLLTASHYILEKRPVDLLVTMGLVALATMVRSASYYLAPLLLMGLLLYGVTVGSRLRQSLSLAIGSLLILAVVLSPQHWRNWGDHQATGFVSQGGTHLLGWVVPAVYQYSGKGSYEEGQQLAKARLDQELQRRDMTTLPVDPFMASSLQSQVTRSIFQEFGLPSVVKAWVVGAMVNVVVPSAAFAPVVRAMDHPSFYATPGRGAAEKIWNYVTDTSGALYLSILLGGALSAATFSLFSLIGWWLSWGNRSGISRPLMVLMTGVVFYFLAITGPIIGSKYRLPIEPIMTIFVAYTVIRLAERWKVS